MATVTYVGPVDQTEWYGVKFTRGVPVTTDNADLIKAAQGNANYTVTGAPAAPTEPTGNGAATLAPATPVRVITEDGINARAIHPAPCKLAGFQFFSLSQRPCYVCLYDLARAPDPAADDPVIGPLPVEAFGELHSPGSMDLAFAKGIALTITGANGDRDATPISADALNGYVAVR